MTHNCCQLAGAGTPMLRPSACVIHSGVGLQRDLEWQYCHGIHLNVGAEQD
jgi:hypothetical protein